MSGSGVMNARRDEIYPQDGWHGLHIKKKRKKKFQ